MNRRALSATAIVAAVLLAGCGEREQTAFYQNGKYRGKPDSRPWDNAPAALASGEWKAGDHATWENAVHARNAGQNEYRRIGH